MGNENEEQVIGVDDIPENETVDDSEAVAKALADEAYGGSDTEDESESDEIPPNSQGTEDVYEMPKAGASVTGDEPDLDEVQHESAPTQETLSDCLTGGMLNTIEGQLDLAIGKFVNDRNVFLMRLKDLDASCDSDETCETIARAARLV